MSASWYSTSWSYRWPISLDLTSTAASTNDFTATIPTDFDLFWNNVLSSGNDVRVTDGDGITLLTYDLAAGFNTTTRSGTIELDNLASSNANVTKLVWLYWGNSGAADARTAFAPAAAKTGYICLDQPDPSYTVQALPERPGATIPAQAVHKVTTEQRDIYWSLDKLFARRSRNYNSSPRYECVKEAAFSVTLGKASQAGYFDAPQNRFCLDTNGQLYYRTRIKSGGDAETTTACPIFYTSLDSRVLVARALIKVNDSDEA